MLRAILLIWAILPVFNLANAANYYYPTGSYWGALNACYAEQTLINHYYCEVASSTSKISNGGNTYNGIIYSKNIAGTTLNTYLFGFTGTTNPATFECYGTSTYNASTGLCSALPANVKLCSGQLDGHGIGAAFSTVIAGKGCMWDQDSDGYLQHADNCPDLANNDQSDLDSDGIGDVCDGCSPDQYDASYTGPGETIATSLPSSFCDQHLCTMTLRFSGCTGGTCGVTFKSNGQQCATDNHPSSLNAYVLASPTSYGFNLSADNQLFGMGRGFAAQTGLNSNLKFRITNCYRASNRDGTTVSVYSSSSSNTAVGCENMIELGQCRTPQELDNDLVSYVKANPPQTTVFSDASGSRYAYPVSGSIKAGIKTLEASPYYVPDSSLFFDGGNGSYTADLNIKYGVKIFNPSSTNPYSDTPNHSEASTLALTLEGCTGNTGSGGGGGSTASGTVSVSQLAENHDDITPTIQGAITEQIDHLSEFLDKANNAGTELTDLFDAEQGDTGQNCIDPNGGTPTNCPNEERQSPEFFDNFTSIFESPSSCPDLTADFGGAGVNLISQFCAMWDQYGRPIFSFIIYWLTLLGIRDIWLGSSPKPR